MSQLTGMIRQSFIRMNVLSRIVILAMLLFFFLFIGTITAVLVAIPVFGLNIGSIYKILENPGPSDIAIIKYFQITQSVCLFLIPSLLAAWLFSNNLKTYLKADKRPPVITIALVMLSVFTVIPFMNLITLWNSMVKLPVWLSGLEQIIRNMEESAAQLTAMFLQGNSAKDLIINFTMIAILPAVGEEFLFRGVLQNLFVEWTKNKHAGIFISAFIFSFIHFQFYGFIPRLLLGLYFGYLLIWTSSIWIPVIAHLINNGIAVIYYHFSTTTMGNGILDTIGTEQHSNYIIYISVFLTSVILAVIYSRGQNKQPGVSNY